MIDNSSNEEGTFENTIWNANINQPPIPNEAKQSQKDARTLAFMDGNHLTPLARWVIERAYIAVSVVEQCFVL